MLGFLIGVVGVVLLGLGVYRASTGTRGPLMRGSYQKAVEVMVVALLMAVAGFTLMVFAASGWSLTAAVMGLAAGTAAAVLGGRYLFRGMVRSVQGGK